MTHSKSISLTRLKQAADGWALRRAVFILAIPAVGEQVLNTLVGLTDQFLVGHLDPAVGVAFGYDRPMALAAVGLGNMIVWITTTLFMAIAVGATALVARRVGEGDDAAADLALRQALLLGLMVGTVATVVGLFGSHWLLRGLGAEPGVELIGTRYLQIIALSYIPTAFMFTGTAALRGAGDTRSPLFLMALVNGVNILLSWLLVNGSLGFPALGVTGSAIGTATGRSLGGLLLVVLFLLDRMQLALHFDWRPDWDILRRICRIGIPSGGEQFIFQGAVIVLTIFVTGLGTVAYAAHNMTIMIESISFLPGFGFGIAASALVGQALGARDPTLAERAGWEAFKQGGAMMTLAGAAMALWPGAIVSIFTPDAEVIRHATGPLRLAGLAQPTLAMGFIFMGALRGAGDTTWPLWLRVIASWCIRIPLVIALLHFTDWGLMAIWTAMAADFVAQGVLALWRFQGGRWKEIEV